MVRKLPRRLVALSASAVAAIYLAGLVSTQPVAATVAATAAPPVATSAATAVAYADGLYSGTGTSRFGNVTVLVTVSRGQIASVQITKVTTSFPASRIASLPAAVVVGQSANVNVVSGATYSSTAFKQAVQLALAQAQAAATTASTQGS
jgi:uncharacterized protein with FMN-binding domain